MTISAMKCALQSLESVEKVKGWNKDSVVGRHCTQSAHFLRQAIEFEEMVKKGTKAWDGTPDDWVDELRGGAEKQEFECPRCGHCCKEWVSLTEEDIFETYKPDMEGMPFNKQTLAFIAGFFEARLKEKNR